MNGPIFWCVFCVEKDAEIYKPEKLYKIRSNDKLKLNLTYISIIQQEINPAA